MELAKNDFNLKLAPKKWLVFKKEIQKMTNPTNTAVLGLRPQWLTSIQDIEMRTTPLNQRRITFRHDTSPEVERMY